MWFELQNYWENANEWADILENNIKIIDETLSKLWYKFDYEDWRAWRIYVATDDPTNKLNVYWWIQGVPKDKKINQEDILWVIFDQNEDLRSDQATQQINELLWINLPKKFDRHDIEDLKWLSNYIKNYRAISFEEYQDIKDTIIYQVR